MPHRCAGAPTPRLDSVSNFRDIAGADGVGYATTDGGHLRPGVYYRSNALNAATDADLQRLTDLGLREVYDLRGQDEIDNPLIGGEDRIPVGAVYIPIPIQFANMLKLASAPTAAADSHEIMANVNRSFVTEAVNREGFAKLLTSLADSADAQLFHCTAGKDRTGWTAALLQSIAGLPRETIFADYLLSNEYLMAENAETAEQINQRLGAEVPMDLTPLLGVAEESLQAAFDAAETEFGGVHGYLVDGLGLDPDTMAELKGKLTG